MPSFGYNFSLFTCFIDCLSRLDNAGCRLQSNACKNILPASGQDIFASIALKPTSSIIKPAETIDKTGEKTEIVTKGRHDPCVGLRATPIGEAMLAIVLMDHFLRNRAQNADVSIEEKGE